MKKVNFKKLTNQFLAGVFGLALMGGVMLHTQDVEAQELALAEISVEGGDDSCERGNPTWRTNWSDRYQRTTCRPGGDCCCENGN